MVSTYDDEAATVKDCSFVNNHVSDFRDALGVTSARGGGLSWGSENDAPTRSTAADPAPPG